MMKKTFAILVIVLAALFGVASFGGCSSSSSGGGNNSYDDPVDYYGCPNSKRIRKLNLKKSKR